MKILVQLLLCLLLNCHSAITINPGSRIAGGIEVIKRTDFPFQVALLYKDAPVCSGTIIDERHVLTSADCCFGNNEQSKTSELTVSVGSLDLYDTSNIKTIEGILIHENFSTETYANNIAILRISGSFENDTKNIQPLSLQADHLTRGNCNVSGWGSNSTMAYMSPKLVYVEIPIIDWGVCSELYSYSATASFIDEKIICAGYGGKGPCQGDGGSPLVCSGNLTGLASYSYRCSINNNYPGIYTEIAPYLEWIESQKSKPWTGGGAGSIVPLTPLIMTIFIGINYYYVIN